MDSVNEPPSKKVKRKCTFCHEDFSEKTGKGNEVIPNQKSVEKLFEVCRRRQDYESKCILRIEELRRGSVTISYHRQCRSTFTSEEHISRAIKRKATPCESIVSTSTTIKSVPLRRSCMHSFEWKANCFICGEPCNPKQRSTWSLVQSAINKNSNIYLNVLKGAEEKQDHKMITRLVGLANGDLVAVEARYHRTKNCYSKYIKIKDSAKENHAELIEDRILGFIILFYHYAILRLYSLM